MGVGRALLWWAAVLLPQSLRADTVETSSDEFSRLTAPASTAGEVQSIALRVAWSMIVAPWTIKTGTVPSYTDTRAALPVVILGVVGAVGTAVTIITAIPLAFMGVIPPVVALGAFLFPLASAFLGAWATVVSGRRRQP